MIFAIVFWIALWRFRSWSFLFAFAAVLAVLVGVTAYFGNAAAPELAGLPWFAVLIATLIDVALNVGIFAAVGAAIVHFRGGKLEKKVSESEIDAELARVRADAAARDNPSLKE